MSVVPLLRAAADRLVLCGGWRRLAAALLAGAAGSLALPPFGLLPALLLAFCPLVWLLDGVVATERGFARLRAAFAAGWCFAFGWFASSLWWVGAAFLADADRFLALLPLGVLGLPALLALFTGTGTAVAALLWSARPGRVFALAAGLGLSEWARATWFTGFPWNSFGVAITANTWQLQAASLADVTALNPVAVFLAAAPAVLADPPRRPGARPPLALPAAALALLVAQFAFGAVRLAAATDDTVPGVRLRIVQPNLTQAERRDRSGHLAIFERYLALTSAPADGAPPPTHVIWPESALPFTFDASAPLMGRVVRALPPGAVLITGLQRPDEDGARVFNTLSVFDAQGQVLDRYDKMHLVPFGEYLPFPGLMARLGLEPLTRVLAFVPGTRRVPIETPLAPPFAPLICYEVIFPAEVRGDGNRPGWFVNISDDSWFGATIGPRQHLQQARLRAVEQGVPVVRATTTGISTVIDAYGRVRGALPIGAAAVLDQPLPVAIAAPMARLSGWSLPLVLLFFALLAAGARKSRHHNL